MTLTQPSTQPLAAQPAEAYLADLRTQLAPITLAEREEILREIAAHIRDSVETGTPIQTVLARLGTPAQLAAEYRDGQLIRTASRSVSPVTLLRATLRLATKSVTGIIVFFFAFFGYITGGAMVIGGVLKPFLPNRIGLFTTSATKEAWKQTGIITNDVHGEMFGWWGVPIALVGGVIILILTTYAIRLFLRLSQRVQRSL
ncbi:MAG: DUF1700 domain-containing protein [Acidobacteriaceae bacterium]|jgi:uncharacterized membrane protein